MKSGKWAGALALVVFCASAAAASAQGKGETVKIQDYPGIGNMLFRIALSKGYCEAHGIKCQLQMIPSGPLGAPVAF
jgi:NitT/TauT family transport system substrate-binding protein